VRSLSLYLLLILSAAVITAASCTGRKNKAEHKDLIPEKDLIGILTDVHLADGLLAVPEITYVYSRGDSLSAYIDIIENHGYTKPQMDRTMRFYFVRKPKKLIRIYDKVLGGLSEMESRIDRELPGVYSGGANIWPGKQQYYYPSPDSEDLLRFDFPIAHYRRYHIKFTITLYPDDQSVNPQLGLFVSHTDSTGIETRTYFSTLPFVRDGKPHTYKASLINDLQPPVKLKGWFIDREGQDPFMEVHCRIEDIILSPYVIN
jgi:hypothetical protein